VTNLIFGLMFGGVIGFFIGMDYMKRSIEKELDKLFKDLHEKQRKK
jgi:hypothetical protein